MTDPEQPKDPYESAEYKCYREDLAQAKSVRLEVFKTFASHSLAISGGLIAAIGYFIKEFNGLLRTWILLVAAGFATASLVATLFELVFSQIATTELEAKLRKAYKEEDHTKESKLIQYYGKWCTSLLYSIPWLILLAVLSTGMFIAMNISHLQKGASEMAEEKKPREIIKCVVTDTSDTPKQPGMRHIANIITDGADKPKERSVPQEKKDNGEKPQK